MIPLFVELKQLVQLHSRREHGDLIEDEVLILKQVLDLKQQSPLNIMTPMNNVFALNEASILDSSLLNQV